MTNQQNDTSFLKNSVLEFCKKESESLERVGKIIQNFTDFEIIEFYSNKLFKHEDYKLKKVLYYFELMEHNKDINGQIICKKIDKIKQSKNNELKLPKVNFNNIELNNKTLYVGKSLGFFSTRLKQHFGGESKKTYALHLNKWHDIIGSDVKLRLYYTSFEKIINDEENELLETIETALHQKLKPLLGRTGH